MPRYLIVGAGAVGQPLAAHLAAGGAGVAFLVREKYAAELKEGPLTLEWLSMIPCGRSRRRTFRDYEVLTSAAEAKQQSWDAVILTVASPALRQGTWLRELVDAVVKPCQGTALVFLTSAMSDRALFDELGVPCEQLVQGGITYISWQAPLPEERSHPVEAAGSGKATAAIGYVLPSFVLSGPRVHSEPLARAMKAGKMSCSVVRDVEAQMAYGEATLMPMLVTLESEGWSFARMRSSGRLSATAAAVRECIAVAQAEAGRSRLWSCISAVFMHPWLLWSLLVLAPKVMPFDIEAYLKFHFCKVGEQTKQYVDDFLRHGRQHGGPEAMASLAAISQSNPRWRSVSS